MALHLGLMSALDSASAFKAEIPEAAIQFLGGASRRKAAVKGLTELARLPLLPFWFSLSSVILGLPRIMNFA